MMRILACLGLILVLCLCMSCSREEHDTVLEILEAEGRLNLSDLWPGFEPLTVPVAIYDGETTVLVRHPDPPEGFHRLPGYDSVWVYDGRHPVMTACTSGEIAGVRTALVTIDAEEQVPIEGTAAVLVHESFHASVGAEHPDWGANEAEAFLYPVEDALGLALRRVEEGALRRAIAASHDSEAGRWSLTALEARNRRFTHLTPAQQHYERGLELVEGIASYVENRSLGDQASPLLPEGAFGAEQIRRRSYDTGRAFCMLLDRLSPGWKNRLEEGPAVPLDSLLAEALAGGDAIPYDISDAGFDEELRRARDDVRVLLESRKREREEFLGAEGWKLEIVAGDAESAFRSVNFDPMNLKLVGTGEILHKRMLKVSGASGTFEAMDRPTLTLAAGDHPLFSGISSVVVTGLVGEPEIREKDGRTVIEAEGVTASLDAASVEREGKAVTVIMR